MNNSNVFSNNKRGGWKLFSSSGGDYNRENTGYALILKYVEQESSSQDSFHPSERQ